MTTPPPIKTKPTPSHTLNALAICTPPSPSRSWQSTPHPYLPLLATASSDKIVRIYSLRTFTQLSTITGGHKRSVRSVAWKPGLKSDRETVLATGSFDATAEIWRGENSKARIGGTARDGGAARDGEDAEEDVDGGEEEGDGDDDYAFAVILEGHDSEIKSLSWSPHGTYLATCSRDKSIWIWEALPDDEDTLETVAVLQEHEGDVKSVAWRPGEESCIASGSYDEAVRIWREDADGEWGCLGIGEGHEGTVWCVVWEPEVSTKRSEGRLQASSSEDESLQSNGIRPSTPPASSGAISGPRLLSCSADLTIRLWRRKPKPPPAQQDGPRIPSILRSSSDEEEWFEEGQLPQRHDRAVYTVAWSEITGRVVSCGSDGKILVYEEVFEAASNDSDAAMQDADAGQEGAAQVVPNGESKAQQSHWKVVAELDAAHGVYEVNHVCWARRYDRHKQREDEEIIVSTGDDGEVHVWTLDTI